jgi:hypothetical protein
MAETEIETEDKPASLGGPTIDSTSFLRLAAPSLIRPLLC